MVSSRTIYENGKKVPSPIASIERLSNADKVTQIWVRQDHNCDGWITAFLVKMMLEVRDAFVVPKTRHCLVVRPWSILLPPNSRLEESTIGQILVLNWVSGLVRSPRRSFHAAWRALWSSSVDQMAWSETFAMLLRHCREQAMTSPSMSRNLGGLRISVLE